MAAIQVIPLHTRADTLHNRHLLPHRPQTSRPLKERGQMQILILALVFKVRDLHSHFWTPLQIFKCQTARVHLPRHPMSMAKKVPHQPNALARTRRHHIHKANRSLIHHQDLTQGLELLPLSTARQGLLAHFQPQ